MNLDGGPGIPSGPLHRPLGESSNVVFPREDYLVDDNESGDEFGQQAHDQIAGRTIFIQLRIPGRQRYGSDPTGSS